MTKTSAVTDWQVTEPGMYPHMTEAMYHADPVAGGSLSSTGARALLPPSCPALYVWERDHPVRKRAFDLGIAAHTTILGKGRKLRLLPYDNYWTNKAQEERDAAYAADEIPVKIPEQEQVLAMAEALDAHHRASGLLKIPDDGRTVFTEPSLFARDKRRGIWRRGRPDKLLLGHGRALVIEYKTAESIDPAAVERATHNHGYHQQGIWYCDLVDALWPELAPAAFLFVMQAKTPPHLVIVRQPDPIAVRYARARNAEALDVYARCVESGVWPGFDDDTDPRIPTVALPRWVESQFMREMAE